MPLDDLAALGSAIAGGAIAASLVEMLCNKNLLTPDEVKKVLDRAQQLIDPHLSTNAPGALEAGQIITSLLRSQTTARN
jgi:hypothetical protein